MSSVDSTAKKGPPYSSILVLLAFMFGYPALLTGFKLGGYLSNTSWETILAAPLLVPTVIGVVMLVLACFQLPASILIDTWRKRETHKKQLAQIDQDAALDRSILAAIMSPHATPFALDLAADAGNQITLQILAALHPSCPQDTRERLLQHPNVLIRRALVFNPELSTEQIEALSKDSDSLVQANASLHPKITASALDRLLKLADPRRYYALHGSDPERLEALAAQEDLPIEVAVALAENPSTLAGGLLYLVRSSHLAVRQGVAAHPNATGAILGILVHDEDKETALLASTHPHARPADAKVVLEDQSPEDIEQLRQDFHGDFGVLGG